MINRRGFTLIELMVVIVVIAILATIVSIGLTQYQENGRDSQRMANATTISEALEKYYDQKGEYPSCGQLTTDGATVSNTTLKGIDQSALVVPNASASTTNSLRCGTTLTAGGIANDFIEYVGDGSPECSGSVSCLSYTLRYRSEEENAVKEIASRRTADIATSGVIRNLQATAVSFTRINLTWAAVPNSTSYTVQRATNDTFTTGLNTQSSTSPSFSSTGLSAGIEYFYRVQPITPGQVGEWSNVSSDTTFALGTTTVTATANSPSQVTVTWDAVEYADASTTYTIQQATNSSFTTGLSTVNGLTGTSRVYTGLAQGTTYYYRVQAKTTADTGDWSAYDSATTPVPGVPTLAVALNSPTQVTASWSAVSGASSYTIQRATDSGFTAGLTTITGATGTSRAITGLTTGTTYYFRMQAIVAV